MNALAETLTPLAGKLAPGATDLLRRDHGKVLAAFHRYDPAASPDAKRALLETIALALEVHAQIEEEIFYPAMRAIDPEVVEKSIPEHEEIRRTLATLRALDPAAPDFTAALMQLMRTVMHHAADEEATLLHHADRILGAQQVKELGARMMERRVQLMMPRASEIARNTARAAPKSALLYGAGALAAAAFVLSRLLRR